MSKEFKEKYERVCQIKDRAISLVETQLNGNIENVDAKELGEVADIAKDMAELMELCAEAEYYHAITEAMEKNSDEENRMQMDKYLPESRFYGGRMVPPIVYTDGGMNGNGNGSRYYHDGKPTVYNPMDRWDEEDFRNRMYYSSMDKNNDGRMDRTTNGRMNYADDMMRDSREGRSGITRRTYMEMKDSDKNKKIEKLKEYVSDFSADMEEMFIEGKATPEEKTVVKQALAQFLSKL